MGCGGSGADADEGGVRVDVVCVVEAAGEGGEGFGDELEGGGGVGREDEGKV